jgi:hypothetical protein
VTADPWPEAHKRLEVYQEHFPHWDALYEAYGEASAETERAFRADLAFAISRTDRIDALQLACSKQNDEIGQTLAKALGYPWYKDDPKNFPDATEADGVCVGEHVAESLAEEAAKRIDALEAENARLTAWALAAERACENAADQPASPAGVEAQERPSIYGAKEEAAYMQGARDTRRVILRETLPGWENISEEHRNDIAAHVRGLCDGPETYPMPSNGWRCFHCGEYFRTHETARLHFGAASSDQATCLLVETPPAPAIPVDVEGLVAELKRTLGEALLEEQKFDNAFPARGQNPNRRAQIDAGKRAWKAYDDAVDRIAEAIAQRKGPSE